MTTRNWDAEYQAKYEQRLADEAARQWDEYVAREQKHRQMLPSDLDRLDCTEEVARANQDNWTEAQAWCKVWQFIALAAVAAFVACGALVMILR